MHRDVKTIRVGLMTYMPTPNAFELDRFNIKETLEQQFSIKQNYIRWVIKYLTELISRHGKGHLNEIL